MICYVRMIIALILPGVLINGAPLTAIFPLPFTPRPEVELGHTNEATNNAPESTNYASNKERDSAVNDENYNMKYPGYRNTPVSPAAQDAIKLSDKPKITFQAACNNVIGSGFRLKKKNQTHKLYLPMEINHTCSENEFSNETSNIDFCQNGTQEIEVQLGDGLLLLTDANPLIQPDIIDEVQNELKEPDGSLYVVTRQGFGFHDSGPSDSGLPIMTPVRIVTSELVMLNELQLNEGVNHLYVASLKCNQQCLAFKLVVKNDNCGDNSDCNGHGLCITNNSTDVYKCRCCTGFTGAYCEEKDPCSSSPCLNNGSCVNTKNKQGSPRFKCICPLGYIGRNCERKFKKCDSSRCQNGGTCVESRHGFTCFCVLGYYGKRCHIEKQHDAFSKQIFGKEKEAVANTESMPDEKPCYTNICLNGGTCRESAVGYLCICQKGYIGKLCSEQYTVGTIRYTVKVNGKTTTRKIPAAIRNTMGISYVYITILVTFAGVCGIALIMTYCCRTRRSYNRILEPSAQLWIGRCRAVRISQQHKLAQQKRERFSNKAPLMGSTY